MKRSNVPSIERSSSTGQGRTSPTSDTQRSSTPGGSPPFDHNLLNRVVRRKRTPIACTECRRRQVKCSGGSPRCERCDKKGVKCEYIPLHQQRMASAAGDATPSNVYGYQAPPTSRPAGGPPVSWRQQRQSLGSVPGYSGQHGDWRSLYPSATFQRYPQQAVQSAQTYGGTPYSQAYDMNLPYPQGEPSVRVGVQNVRVESPYGYPSSSAYTAYGQHTPSGMSAGDPRLQYRVSPEQEMASSSSQTGSYPTKYHGHGAQPMYYQGAAQGSSEGAPSEWTDPTTYP